MTVLFYFLSVTVGFDYLLDMLRTELVLRLDFLKLLAGINEQDVVILLAALLKHKDASRYARTIENVGRQTDNSIYVVLLLDEETADNALGITTEQHTVRSYKGRISFYPSQQSALSVTLSYHTFSFAHSFDKSLEYSKKRLT